MSNYQNKLSTLAEKKRKLYEEELQVIQRRKKEIGELAERFGLLTADDTFLIGILLEAQTALLAQSEKYTQWESEGTRFLASKKPSSKKASSAKS